MKLNSCTTIELTKIWLQSLESLVRLADKMGKIDAILAVHKYNEMEEDLIQAELRYIKPTLLA
jgi:hypothetical protein